jgi:hypothetical protein
MPMPEWAFVLQSMSEVGTTLGVGFAAWQLLQAHRQATTSFEDSVAREYRSIAHSLPVGALLGDVLTEEQFQEALDEFYHYIDLSNEQVFLRCQGRVSREAWQNWRDGIRDNLSKPAFKAAWDHVKSKAPHSFHELRSLEATQFSVDPKGWKQASR